MESCGRRFSNSHCMQLCAQLHQPSERCKCHRARDAIPARRADHVLYIPERMAALIAIGNARAHANDANIDDASGVGPCTGDYSRSVMAPRSTWAPAPIPVGREQCVMHCRLQTSHQLQTTLPTAFGR